MVGSRKICGTLVEAVSSPSKLEAVVIGIGLNVNADAPELPPEGISMKMLRNTDYSVAEILDHILNELGNKCNDLYKKIDEK